jgi:hypothetical protein
MAIDTLDLPVRRPIVAANGIFQTVSFQAVRSIKAANAR